MMFLRPNVNQVRDELARQQDQRDTFREGAEAVKTGLARYGNTIDTIDG